MAKFMYNNSKNTNTNYTYFELNCSYHLCIFFVIDINLNSHSKIVTKLVAKLKKLLAIYYKNLYHTKNSKNKP